MRIHLVCVVVPSARAAVDKNSAALITDLVTTSLDKEQRFEVLSVRPDVAAAKQVVGCV